jgi:hypothetical protein
MGRLARAEERAAEHFGGRVQHPGALAAAAAAQPYSAQEFYVRRMVERSLAANCAARWLNAHRPELFEP